MFESLLHYINSSNMLHKWSNVSWILFPWTFIPFVTDLILFHDITYRHSRADNHGIMMSWIISCFCIKWYFRSKNLQDWIKRSSDCGSLFLSYAITLSYSGATQRFNPHNALLLDLSRIDVLLSNKDTHEVVIMPCG